MVPTRSRTVNRNDEGCAETARKAEATERFCFVPFLLVMPLCHDKEIKGGGRFVVKGGGKIGRRGFPWFQGKETEILMAAAFRVQKVRYIPLFSAKRGPNHAPLVNPLQRRNSHFHS